MDRLVNAELLTLGSGSSSSFDCFVPFSVRMYFPKFSSPVIGVIIQEKKYFTVFIILLFK